jgi:5-carboxymethyl-2-hydroxymuconic-semialdehyde dehydrogenase
VSRAGRIWAGGRCLPRFRHRGRLAPSVSGGTFDVADPATNQVYAQVAAGDVDDVDKAVEAAVEAFKRGPWARLAARAAENFRYFADVVVAQHEDAFSQPASSATCSASRPGWPGWPG